MSVHDHDGGGQQLLDDLEVLPAGGPLALVLDEVVVEAVSGHDAVRVVTAAYRQLCRARGLFLAVLLESGLRRPGSAESVERVDEPGEFACEEARAALVWSRSRASRQFGFAVEVFMRLPAVGAAMLAGEVDEPRARAFTEWTLGLGDAHGEAVCDALLGEAPRLTVGELIDRIKQLCLALDPGWAEQRYRAAVQRRRVTGFRNPDGTASLTGQNQPIERVAAACARIDSLARTCKLAGDTRPVDHIRSDLYLGMTDGTFTGMDDRQIAAHVRNHPYTMPTDPDHNSDNDNDPGSDNDSDDGDSDDGDSDNDGGDGDGDGDGDSDSDGGGDGGDGSDGSGGGGEGRPAAPLAADSPSVSTPGDAVPAGPSAPAPRPAPAGASDAAGPGPAGWSVAELRVRLSTLLGLDQYPAEIPPWGHVPAAVARGLTAAMASAEWRYVICGPDGQARTGGLLTARPASGHHRHQIRRDARRGGIIEIAVATTELAQLQNLDPGPTWAPVHTEILHLLTAHTTTDTSTTDTSSSSGDSGSGTTDTGATSGGQAQTRRRYPTARLRRWIQIRDRVCTHPCCRAPARSADQDHRQDYRSGGATDDANLEPKCRHDHRLRHDGAWQTYTDPDGTTVWVSPLGHRYQSRPPPVMAHLPKPLPPDPDQRPPLPDRGWLTWEPAPPPCACPNTACTCQPPLLPPPPTRTREQPDNSKPAQPDSDAPRTDSDTATNANTKSDKTSATAPRRPPLPAAWRGETTTLLATNPPPF